MEVYGTTTWSPNRSEPLAIALSENSNVRAERFADNLLPTDKPIPVALSGGKDSLFLNLVLRKLGYETVPIIVDMGYSPEWGENLAKRLGKEGNEPEVIDVHSGFGETKQTRIELGRRLEHLDEIRDVKEFTPCTHCYSSKVLALETRIKQLGCSTIAFGHHRTDSTASLIKSGLMYMDRWGDEASGHEPNESFNRDNFISLAEELRVELEQSQFPFEKGPLATTLEELAEDHQIDSDEPMRQLLLRNKPDGAQMIRPFFHLDEQVVEHYIRLSNMQAEGSGCGHGATIDTETPREIVHNRVLKKLTSYQMRHSVIGTHQQRFLSRLIEYGLSEDGSSRFSTRYKRSEQLGPQYKPSEIEKL